MKTLMALINDPINSEDFVSYSTSLARDLDVNLHLMYVQNPALYSLSSGTTAPTSHPVGTEIEMARLEEERGNALKSLELELESYRKEIVPGKFVELSSHTGSAEVIINQYVAENKADMLLISNENGRGFWNLETPNTELVSEVNCPCLVIPAGAKYKSFDRIVYATDYSEKDIPVIRNLITFTRAFSPMITALHVGKTENDSGKSVFGDIAGDTGYDKISVMEITEDEDGNLSETVNNFAVNHDANLIVVLKQNRKFFERIFRRSQTKKVIRKTVLPVLVFHETELD